MKKTLLIATAASILLFTGCTASKQEAAAPAKAEATVSKEAVEKAIAVAEMKYKEVKAMRSIVWRHTKKAIDQAKEALAKGDLTTAHKKALTAHFEAKSAIEQSAENDKIWQGAMPQALMQ